MMRVIHTVGNLAPESGGPARTVPNLALAQADQGADVAIIAPDFGDRLSPPLVPEHPRVQVLSLQILFRWGLKSLLFSGLNTGLDTLTRDADQVILHDHGIWLPQNYLVCRYAFQKGYPLVISPRGMLNPEALAYRRIRKQVAWTAYQGRALKWASGMHATSSKEKASLRDLGLSQPVQIIPNGTVIPPWMGRQPRPEGSPMKLLFLSRIHPTKGLMALIRALDGLGSEPWELTLAGYDELNHLAEVLDLALQLGIRERIRHLGPIGNQEKWSLYQEADLFVLPSLTENFGLVVAEALASGLPVITTTGTPWEELSRYNCGWYVEPTEKGIQSALKDALRTSAEDLIQMGKNGRRLAEEKYSWDAVGSQMLSFYQEILAG